MKECKLVEKYKILNKGVVTFFNKFRCNESQLFEDDGQIYLKMNFTDDFILLLPVEEVKDCDDIKKTVEEDKIPAKTILRKLFHKKVKKNLEN